MKALRFGANQMNKSRFELTPLTFLCTALIFTAKSPQRWSLGQDAPREIGQDWICVEC